MAAETPEHDQPFKRLQERAREVRQQYAELEREQTGKEWNPLELAAGFVGDVGALMKLAMAKEGLRHIDGVDAKLRHELADCLWSVLVLADAYGIDLETAFADTMTEIEQRIGRQQQSGRETNIDIEERGNG